MNTHEAIVDFLSQRTLAVVGVSRGGKKFGNAAYRALKEKGYRVFPVNPSADTVEGDTCYRNLKSLPEKVDGVVLVVPPAQTEQVVGEVFEAGIRRVWMQQGSESYRAVRYCERKEINVIYGYCILMFAEPLTRFHKMHRWAWKLTGKLPRGQTASAQPKAQTHEKTSKAL